jgi:hypothetical protein
VERHRSRRRAEKRGHARELALTHFIDDRADVLEHLRGVVSHLFLFGAQAGSIPDWVVPVADWRAARAALLVGDDQVRGRHVVG